MRIVLVYNNLGPYHHARIYALSQLVTDLLVIEIAGKSVFYNWNALQIQDTQQLKTLFVGKRAETLSYNEVHKELTRVLDSYEPDVVITAGYYEPAAQIATKWGISHGAKIILMLASWKGDKRRWWIKEKIKAWVIQHAYNAAFVGGELQRAYALSLGFPEEKIWRGVDVVDNDHFAVNTVKVCTEADNLRDKLGLPKQYFICVVRLTWEKNLMTLLKAYQLYKETGGEWSLVLVGDGPQREELEKETQKLHLGDKVIFSGWVQYDQLPAYYELANALVLPSISEPWGLVVNEAMAAGLPILVSRQCGCSPELCWRGINGYDFDPHHKDEIARLMLKLSSNPINSKQMGQVSQQIIKNFTPVTWASALKDCIDSVSGE